MSILSYYHPNNFSEDHHLLEKHVGWYSLFISMAIVSGMWLIKLIEFEFNLNFSDWGIYPRNLSGMRGIFFSPMIHADFSHLAANTPAFWILTFTLFFFYRRPAPLIFLLIYLFSGVFVWLGGREAWHIGASGLIYGLAAFLFLGGVLSKNIRQLTISMIVALIYGSLLWGIFPIKPEISWESHLWGGVSGFGLAFIFRNAASNQPSLVEEADDEEDFDWSEEIEEETESKSEEK